MATDNTMFGTGQLPKFDKDQFGLFVVGPLEKFGLFGFELGLLKVIN